MRSRTRTQNGAAAVEFALVSVLLFPFLLGIIDYGLWFNDSLNTRQGVREAARLGVVKNISNCGTAADDMAKLVCMTNQQIGSVAGPSYAMVKAPDGWAKGKPLVVCAMVRADGVTGMTPMPNDRLIKSKTQMSIEVETPVPTGNLAGTSDSPPSGASWSWCT